MVRIKIEVKILGQEKGGSALKSECSALNHQLYRSMVYRKCMFHRCQYNAHGAHSMLR